jgi:myo-inositol-1-phosphate synthase
MSEQNGKQNGKARLDDRVRVALVGVGNCANSLLQGVEYYKDAPGRPVRPGLMHVNLGGYHVRDIEFTAAFDVTTDKVGKGPRRRDLGAPERHDQVRGRPADRHRRSRVA